VLFTYPVATDRLDVYNLFLTPAGVHPRVHKTIESTDLMLQMVAAGRGVAALPRWLVEEHSRQVPIQPVKLGQTGVPKKIHLGLREVDREMGYLRAFIDTARSG
jgi:LysR family transcriptional regulator for metE and metH